MAVNRRDLLLRGGIAAGALAAGRAEAQAGPQTPSPHWDAVADVVVIGAGACGTTAAIAAREAGRSVILLEREPHGGGHAITSGGNVPLGGGTSLQKKYGITDTPDQLFADLTDWSVVEPNGAADYRYNDREIIRAFADNSAATFEFLVAHGVVFVDKAPDNVGGRSVGNSVPREAHTAPMDWPLVQTNRPADPAVRTTMSTGNGLMHPLIAAAQNAGVDLRLQHAMTGLHREDGGERRVIGVAVSTPDGPRNIRAAMAVILGTGGSTSNINFRRMSDPRLTAEYEGVAGLPWSVQDGSGEIAAMAVGAWLWGMANQSGEFGAGVTKAGKIGCKYGYENLTWQPTSTVFDRAGATGLRVRDWQNVIMVNMLGRRFYDETARAFHANGWNTVKDYVPTSYRNAADIAYKPDNLINAALAGIGDGHNGGGPIWAIFDADAAAREAWTPEPPQVDIGGYFFTANTLPDLAKAIVMQHQRVPMPPEQFVQTVARYNSFVEAGADLDFGKPKPLYKIAKPPFYAGWATPVPHDTRSGLRIDARCRVMDMQGEVIAGLFCGGESAGGFSQHGLARAACQGFIAGRNAAASA